MISAKLTLPLHLFFLARQIPYELRDLEQQIGPSLRARRIWVRPSRPARVVSLSLKANIALPQPPHAPPPPPALTSPRLSPSPQTTLLAVAAIERMRHCALVSLDGEPDSTMADIARRWLDRQAEKRPGLARLMPELQADAADYAATWALRQARERDTCCPAQCRVDIERIRMRHQRSVICAAEISLTACSLSPSPARVPPFLTRRSATRSCCARLTRSQAAWLAASAATTRRPS